MALRASTPPLQPVQSNTAWRILLVSVALVVVFAFLPPLVKGPMRGMVMAAFSPLCHQLPERTIHLAGVPLAACSRCIGIYVGLLGGLAIYPLVGRRDVLQRLLGRYTGLMLIAAVAVPGIDWLAGILHVWESGHVVRMVTGAVFGTLCGLFMARAAEAIGSAPSGPSAAVDAASSTGGVHVGKV